MAQSIRKFSSWGGEDEPHLQTNCGQQLERRDGSVNTSGGEELRGGPLVYIPDLVQRFLSSWKTMIG